MPGTEVASGDENISGAVTIASGTVNVGNRRDIGEELLCDTVGQFLRKYTVNDAGAVTTMDTLLDGVTPYVTVGTVGQCGVTVLGNFETTDLWQNNTFEDKVGYGFATNLINVALAVETDFVLFRNPAASGKVARIWEQIPSIPDSPQTVRSVVRIYKNPTVTANGVAQAVGGLRNGQPASAMLVTTGPTIAARGTLVNTYGINYAPFVRTLFLARFVEPGDSILWTYQPNTPTVNHSLAQAWSEVTP